MVTKSRLSPFAITKGRREKKEGKEASSKSNAEGSNNFERWLPFLDAKTLSGKESNVRGLNYHNELQTDTSVAIETKFMQRWEFDSIDKQ
ncbi:hypothetical protein F383_07327 [Gossypium arboreum]|uniref:Uncharacterized protein n=1 Tax=Gossypium arboreum TaxID=29729 RepID=A0A0B0P1D8_GOSAR|nr:hypothetical protein F383_07327 [Gossypium arboreum]